jgi:SAM-dependent methyltransferase
MTSGSRVAPLKALARGVRNTAFRAVSLMERIVGQRGEGLLPPAHLRVYYYGSTKPDVFERMCGTLRTEVISRGLLPDHRLLDIGSGIGNLPISLLSYLRGGYDGVEIHPEAVGWCQRAITPRHPSFRFHRADISSRAYNPKGTQSPSTYRFPFSDESFDFIVLGSVFTHMLPDDVTHYVREIARLLKPSGVCVASYLLINEERRAAIEAGRSFMSFRIVHPSGVCRLHDATVPEAAVALEEDFVRRIHAEVGLAIRDIRRGEWWNGKVHDQDVLTSGRKWDGSPLNPA